MNHTCLCLATHLLTQEGWKVELALGGWLVGYIPKEMALYWSCSEFIT